MADRVPLPFPLYGATFGEAVGRFFRKYAVFSGRASRSEFWWVYLFLTLVGFAVGILAAIVAAVVVLSLLAPALSRPEGRPTAAEVTSLSAAILGVYALILVIYLPFVVPSIAIVVRRLHDAGFSGLFYLLALIPGGSIAVIVLCVLDSNPAGVRFDAPAPARQPLNGTEPPPSPTIRS